MRKKAQKTLLVTGALTLVGGAAALASGPLHGKTYEGGAPSHGITSEGHHPIRLHAGGNIIIRVAGNGGSVTVRFSSPYPVLYCTTGKALQVQKTTSARVSGGGTFQASIEERFKAGPGAPAIVQVVTGRFNGHWVSGTIYTRAGECGGTSTYSAYAR
jgi:hypothetical protein